MEISERICFTLTIQLHFFCLVKHFVNAIKIFFEGGNSQRKQLAGSIPQKKKKHLKTLTFFYVYSVFLYKNKCYIPSEH